MGPSSHCSDQKRVPDWSYFTMSAVVCSSGLKLARCPATTRFPWLSSAMALAALLPASVVHTYP